MSSATWTPQPWRNGIRQMAVITGASSGIGEEFARQLAPTGLGLILIARRRERLQRLGEHLASTFGVPVELEVCDLTDRVALEALAGRLEGRADIGLLVSNAGVGLRGRFVTSDASRQIAQLDLHVIASTRLARAVLPQMIARGHGAIVQVSSLAGVFPRLSSPTYGSSKAYLNDLTDALAVEAAGSAVCFQSLCPGFTVTEFHSTPEFDGIDVHARIPGFLWLSAERVVRESLEALAKGQRMVIPSRRYRWLKILGANRLSQSIAARWRASRRRLSFRQRR